MTPGKTKKLLLFTAIAFIWGLCYSTGISAQTTWMLKAGSSTIDEGEGISTDDSSNTYTTGYFTGSGFFGPFNLTALGVSDVFVTKTDKSGGFKWAVKGGDGGSDRGLAIKTDSKGNSYVTGYYYSTATFGAKTVTSAGLQDVFIAKYDRNGNIKWLVTGGGPESDIGNAITVDNTGDVIVTGQFQGTAKFGAFTLTSTANNVNVFTAKLDSSNGNFLWAKSGVGPHTDRGLGVSCDPTGNVYVTGQFSDSITFDNAHFSNLFDAIFVIKYNSSGVEQWFTKAGGGTFNIANGIAVDNSSNVYITGSFTGTLTFFVSPPSTLTNPYANRIFVAKYNSGGSLLWATADGSSNPLVSNSISLDSVGNAYIVGNFECLFNGYADKYGQGTFNSVGMWDIFVAEYSSGGTWQWGRQIAGHGNNYGNSIAMSSKGDIYTAGSFDQDMIVTSDKNFLGYNVSYDSNCNTSYCSDSHYGEFAMFNTTGNLDVFIAKPIDLTRQTYDFFIRSGGGCNRPQNCVCINPNCPDTVKFCVSGALTAYTQTCPNIGPGFTFSWSNHASGPSIAVSTTGWYSVTETATDGCITCKDSIYVVILPPIPQPNLSDNVIINVNATSPKPIHICGDSVLLTGGGYGAYRYYWSGGSTATTVSIEAKKTGTYCFNVTDANGCSSAVCVQVTLDSAFVNIGAKLKCLTCSHDTAAICTGSSFTMLPYDTISNPLANPALCIPPSNYVVNKWEAKPGTISYSALTYCPNANAFIPADSGWYHISDTITRANLCDTVKTVVSDSVFVRLYPVPVIGPISITGTTLICPGDSALIIAHDTAKFVWSTGSTKDSLWVKAGFYSIFTSITNKYGCSASAGAGISVNYKTPPNIVVSPNNGVICPGDSLELFCTGIGKFQWYGPPGPMGANSSSIYVTIPGSYYCVVTDTAYCNPVLSNTVVVGAYATPYLAAGTGNSLICPGDSAKISVVSSAGSVIQWEAPLSGSDSVMYVKKAGSYTCKIVSCGITTTVNFSVSVADPIAIIKALGSKNFCTGDSVTLTANAGMAKYVWSPGGSTSTSITVTKTGVYTLTTTDTNGCKANDTTHIAVSKNSIINPKGVDTSICPGNTVTLFAEGEADLIWYSSDTSNIPLGYGATYTTPGISSVDTFWVQTFAANGCKSPRIPVTINILDDCSYVYVPNIFTPNGDGKDDIWYPTIIGSKCYTLHIYNRWGVLVFISNSVDEGWNGIIRQTNLPASDGVYYYIIEFCDYLDNSQKRDGFLQLIRH